MPAKAIINIERCRKRSKENKQWMIEVIIVIYEVVAHRPFVYARSSLLYLTHKL